MSLPKYVQVHKKSYCYKPFLGRVDGKIKWGPRVRLGPVSMSEEEVWASFNEKGLVNPPDKIRPFPDLPPQHNLNTAYAQAKKNAKIRGIEWRFTKEEWYEWWGDDIHKRGSKAGCLQMCRHGDTGPYHPDNVSKKTIEENGWEGYLTSIGMGQWHQ
jgi:hypothetical protein